MKRHKLEPVRVNPVLLHPSERRESLNGEWLFRLDPDDVGVSQRWFEGGTAFNATCHVPGNWQGRGHGGDSNDRIWDFGLEARTFRATYKGTGWYGRVFTVPDSWRESRIQLFFGGVHPSAEIWLNGMYLGSNDMPFVPFGFDVTDAIRFSSDNFVAVRVHEYARLYGLAYSWQGNWSGIYRAVDLPRQTGTGSRGVRRIRKQTWNRFASAWILTKIQRRRRGLLSRSGPLTDTASR